MGFWNTTVLKVCGGREWIVGKLVHSIRDYEYW
jgi:hypothetical protein